MSRSRAITLLVSSCLLAGAAVQAEGRELPDLSLEELMAIRVVATPKFPARIADVPASVSVLTARDIQTYGWRTLADALRTLAGFNITYDRTYSYAGVRGLAPPGDFKPRLALLIDGMETNENIYDSALLGGELPLDLDLVERIEIIRGPGASVYGGNAATGVINVVTRAGRDVDGFEASASLGSHSATGLRGSWGGRTTRGLDFLLSATGYEAQGATLTFPEMASFERGIRTRDDDESRRQLFARLSFDDWHALLVHGQRDKQVPTGSYGTIFDDPRHTEDDGLTLGEIGNDLRLGSDMTLASRLYAGHYTYDGRFPYDYEPLYVINHDRVVGDWWGAELRWQRKAWHGQDLIAGLEYRDNTRLDQKNYDTNELGLGCIDADQVEPCLDDRRTSRRWSAYLQDEVAIGARLRVTVGARYDDYSAQGGEWTPRLGVVYHSARAGSFKLLYAEASHEANVFERYYALPPQTTGNPDLRPERLRSLEAIWSGDLTPATHVSASLYAFRMQDMIVPDDTGRNDNAGTITARGVELTLDHRWDSGVQLRANYSAQHARQDDGDAPNVPSQMLKLNAAMPVGDSWTVGAESQAMTERRSESGAWTPGYVLCNLTVSHEPAHGHWRASLGIYNLFDREYVDPVAADPWLAEPRDAITQDGRSLRLKVTGRL